MKWLNYNKFPTRITLTIGVAMAVQIVSGEDGRQTKTEGPFSK